MPNQQFRNNLILSIKTGLRYVIIVIFVGISNSKVPLKRKKMDITKT